MSRIFKISFLLFAFLQWNKASFAQYKLNNIPHQYYQINQVDNNGRQGVWYFFDQQDSTVFAMQNFRNDTLNGYFERYWHNGLVSEKGYYKNGCLDSIFFAYWKTGLLRGSFMYKNCKPHGESTTFNASGKLTSRMLWINGEVDYNYEKNFINNVFVKDSIIENKFDTVVYLFNSVYNKEIVVYINDILSEHIVFYKDIPRIANQYKSALLHKRIIYSKSKRHYIKTISYFEKEKHVKTEYFNRKGKLVKIVEAQTKQ